MKIFIKKLAICFLSFSLLLIAPIHSTFADENNQMIITVDEYGYEIAVDAEGRNYKYFDIYGNYVPASQALMEEETIYYSTNRAVARVAPYSFTIRSSTTGYGSAKKVSASCKGPCTITYSNTITTTQTFSITLSASLQAKFIATFQAQTGATWSKSSSTSLSYSLPVDSGKTGAVYFKPKIRTVQSTYYDDNYSPTYFTATCPVTLDSGVTDGLFYVVYE